MCSKKLFQSKSFREKCPFKYILRPIIELYIMKFQLRLQCRLHVVFVMVDFSFGHFSLKVINFCIFWFFRSSEPPRSIERKWIKWRICEKIRHHIRKWSTCMYHLDGVYTALWLMEIFLVYWKSIVIETAETFAELTEYEVKWLYEIFPQQPLTELTNVL